MNKIIVIICFVVIVIVFSVKLYLYQKKNDSLYEKFPPHKTLCPDYWKVVSTNKYIDSNGKQVVAPVCQNINSLGKCNIEPSDSIMDFTSEQYTGDTGDLFKCTWARHCDVTWQGYSDIC